MALDTSIIAEFGAGQEPADADSPRPPIHPLSGLAAVDEVARRADVAGWCVDPGRDEIGASSPWDELAAHLDERLGPAMSEAEVLDVLRAPVVLTAYRRIELPKGEAAALAELALQAMLDRIDLEYAGPDLPAITKVDEAEIFRRLEPVAGELVARIRNWWCEPVASVALSGAEVEMWARAHTDWLEDGGEP